MISIVPRFLSSPNSWLTKESPVYFRPRPQEIINYALTALTLDLIVTLVAFVIANKAFDVRLFADDHLLSGLAITGFIIVVWLVMLLVMSVYPSERLHSLGQEVFRASVAVLNGSFVLVSVLTLTGVNLPRDFFLVYIASNITLVIVWRLVTHALFQIPAFNRSVQRTLVIGVNDLSLWFTETVTNHPKSKIAICGFLDDNKQDRVMGFPVLGNSRDDLQTIIEKNQIDSVVIVLPTERDSAFGSILEKLQVLPVRLHVIPEYFDLKQYRPSAEAMDRMLSTSLPRIGIGMRERMLKRMFDIIISSILLLMILPVAVCVALAIKLDSPGPIFFRQLRVGEYQRRFHMFKFRSMKPNAEKMQAEVNVVDALGNVIHKRPDDPRVTRIGKVIRKTSLDELPQLLNVLLGDMSLVGPRPEMPWVVNNYKPWQFQRFVVPPGMTGWWQINGRNNSKQPMYMGTEDDLYYIENYSFLLDLRILALTIPVVLSGRGSF